MGGPPSRGNFWGTENLRIFQIVCASPCELRDDGPNRIGNGHWHCRKPAAVLCSAALALTAWVLAACPYTNPDNTSYR